MQNSDQLGYQKQNSSDMYLFIAKNSKNIFYLHLFLVQGLTMYLTNIILYNFKSWTLYVWFDLVQKFETDVYMLFYSQCF